MIFEISADYYSYMEGVMLYINHVATALFALAVFHTFLAFRLRRIATWFPEGSKRENFFHLMGETEVVFLLWAGILWVAHILFYGWEHLHGNISSVAHLESGLEHGFHKAIAYIESLNYTEPKFVFVIMVIAATKPIIDMADKIIRFAAWFIPLPSSAAFLFAALFIGTQLGSLMTEPAAMTVTATVLSRQFFKRPYTRWFKYLLLGTLFVCVSIGGVHTHFAAPPVLMVASQWDWNVEFMFRNFGCKAAVAVFCSTLLVVCCGLPQLRTIPLATDSDLHDDQRAAELPITPWWVSVVHLIALALVVLTAHHPNVFFGVFVFFLGFCVVTKEYQEALKLKEGLLVGGFLAGLVTLGGLQAWWIEPLLARFNAWQLYLGATGLTAITDNAALTYLGSQVEGLSSDLRYLLVAGAVCGGGLTVIANAPNPAGYAILNKSFNGESSGISAIGLFAGALPATLIAMACFWWLPSL